MADEADESLGEILKPSTGETTAPPADTRTRDQAGKFTKDEPEIKVAESKVAEPVKAETVDPKPEIKTEPKPEKPQIDVSALISERRKRQEAEARLRELESKKPEKTPSVFEDEDKAIGHRVDSGTRPLREALFNQSVKIARLLHKDDYESAERSFSEAAEKDDRLIEALRRADDPGEFIYTTGLQLRELGDVGGDFVKYREKLTGDLRTQLTERDTRIAALERQVADLTASQADLSAVPKSLNTRSSSPKAGELEPDDDIASIARFNQRKTG